MKHHRSYCATGWATCSSCTLPFPRDEHSRRCPQWLRCHCSCQPLEHHCVMTKYQRSTTDCRRTGLSHCNKWSVTDCTQTTLTQCNKCSITDCTMYYVVPLQHSSKSLKLQITDIFQGCKSSSVAIACHNWVLLYKLSSSSQLNLALFATPCAGLRSFSTVWVHVCFGSPRGLFSCMGVLKLQHVEQWSISGGQRVAVFCRWCQKLECIQYNFLFHSKSCKWQINISVTIYFDF